MIMLTDAARSGEPDELVFIAAQHIVGVWFNPQDSDGGSIVSLSTGKLLHVAEDRDEIVGYVEAAEK